MRVAAIDIGAGLTKAVLVDENGTILQKSALKTGASPVEAAAKALTAAEPHPSVGVNLIYAEV